jgi:N-acetylglutamate synthase/N-acetylornithine aminotransferase
VDFDMDSLSIDYGGVTVCRNGIAATHDPSAVARHMAGSSIDIHCRLGLADGNAVVMGVDLGHGYIDENRTTS